VRFAGVMTPHTARTCGMKPRDANTVLVRALAERSGADAAADVPAAMTNIIAAN
jgi:hypothetical protein